MIFLWAQFLSTLCMLVIIVVTQYLIYPQFHHVGESELSVYASSHMNRMGFIVIPIMLVELITLAIIWFYPEMRSFWLVTGTIVLMAIWALTFLKIIPVHEQIVSIGGVENIQTLIQLNFYRMILWIIKGVVITGLFVIMITPSLKRSFINQANVDSEFKKPNGYRMELEVNLTKEQFEKEIIFLNPESINKIGESYRYIVRTPMMKFPDLLIVRFDEKRTILWSQSLIGYSDLGANQKRLERIAQKLSHSRP